MAQNFSFDLTRLTELPEASAQQPLAWDASQWRGAALLSAGSRLDIRNPPRATPNGPEVTYSIFEEQRTGAYDAMSTQVTPAGTGGEVRSRVLAQPQAEGVELEVASAGLSKLPGSQGIARGAWEREFVLAAGDSLVLEGALHASDAFQPEVSAGGDSVHWTTTDLGSGATFSLGGRIDPSWLSSDDASQVLSAITSSIDAERGLVSLTVTNRTSAAFAGQLFYGLVLDQTIPVSSVPAPSAWVSLLLGLFALAGVARGRDTRRVAV